MPAHHPGEEPVHGDGGQRGLEHFDVVQGEVTADGADVGPSVARKR